VTDTVDINAQLTRLVDAVVRHRAVAAASEGVVSNDLMALASLERRGVLRPADLARELAMSSGGATTMVRRLADAQLVHKDPGPANHRNVRVSITAKGLQLLAATRVDELMQRDVLVIMDVASRAACTNLFARLADSIERYTADTLRSMQSSGREERLPPPRWG
jgi:DNA-binding MarR family transcriptional regulator